MDAKNKELSEYVRLLFRLGRIAKQDVVAWADAVIATNENAPSWAIALAMAGNRNSDELETLLLHVPGQVIDDLPRKMVVCRVRDDWVSGRISDEDLINEWYALYPEYPDNAESMHAAPVWQYLDEVLVSIYSGDDIAISLAAARAVLANLLEPYAHFAPLAQPIGRTNRCTGAAKSSEIPMENQSSPSRDR
jgi:hypothetical protein